MPTIRANTAVDPSQIADMFNPIAKALAPPTAQEILAGAKGRQIAQQIQQTKDLYDYAAQPGFDQQLYSRRLAAAGIQNENASMEAVDRNNANARFTNAADNAAKLQQARMHETGETTRTLLAPVPENGSRFIPPSIASQFEIPTQQIGVVKANEGQVAALPGGGTVEGRQKPLNMSEMEAAVFGRQDPAFQRSVVGKGVGYTNVIGSDGKTVVMPNDQAAGMTPAPSDFKPQIFNYQLPNGGGSVPVRTGSDGALYSTQTGEKVADGGQTFSSNLTGSKEQTGLGGATANTVDQKIMDIKALRTTAQQYKALLKRDPGAVGIVGTVRGLSQDVAATAREAGAMLPGLKQSFEREIAAGNVAPEVLQELMPNGQYNANIPQAKMLQLLLASQFAKFLDPNGRISNDRMNQVSASLGHGSVLSNVDQTNANLDGMLQMLDTQEKYLVPTRPDTAKAFGVGGAASAAPAAAQPTGAPVRRRYNPATGALE